MTHLKRVSFVSFIYGRQHRFVDPEAQCGGDEGQRQVAHNTNNNIIGHHGGEELDVTTHLIREMYRTARRHTRTEPHTMPESRGFSQYSRELIWSELGHMVTRLGMSHWMCLYSCMTPGSPGLGVTVTTLDPATGESAQPSIGDPHTEQ